MREGRKKYGISFWMDENILELAAMVAQHSV
jgi:hypothetical protein